MGLIRDTCKTVPRNAAKNYYALLLKIDFSVLACQRRSLQQLGQLRHPSYSYSLERCYYSTYGWNGTQTSNESMRSCQSLFILYLALRFSQAQDGDWKETTLVYKNCIDWQWLSTQPPILSLRHDEDLSFCLCPSYCIRGKGSSSVCGNSLIHQH